MIIQILHPNGNISVLQREGEDVQSFLDSLTQRGYTFETALELPEKVEALESLLGGQAEAMMSSAFGDRFDAFTQVAEALLESSPNLVEDSEALLTRLKGTADPIIKDPIIKDPGGSLEPIGEETLK